MSLGGMCVGKHEVRNLTYSLLTRVFALNEGLRQVEQMRGRDGKEGGDLNGRDFKHLKRTPSPDPPTPPFPYNSPCRAVFLILFHHEPY